MSYKDIKSFEQECKEKDTEIERLKAEVKDLLKQNESMIEQFKSIRELCYSKDKLITDLADTLESACLELSWDAWPEIEKRRLALIQSAREATR